MTHPKLKRLIAKLNKLHLAADIGKANSSDRPLTPPSNPPPPPPPSKPESK
jgi:hypothetical protein